MSKKNYKERPICARCGSDKVTSDATASWDMKTQSWKIAGINDGEYCAHCDDLCTIINVDHTLALELQVFPMKKDDQGSRLVSDRYEQPDHFDVALRQVNYETGKTSELVERDELSYKDAMAFAQSLCEMEHFCGLQIEEINP